MKIIWNGHACFTLRTEDGSLVLDPYADGKVPGLKPLRLQADLVLCSHEHADHNARECVKLSGKSTHFKISAIDTWHDDAQGKLRGPNRIHIIETEKMKVVHLGDLGCDLTQEEIGQLSGCDVLMIPVGGHYTIDGKQAAEIAKGLSARVILPMHFRSGNIGYDVISTADDFLRYQTNIVTYPGAEIEITAATPAQTAVLKI